MIKDIQSLSFSKQSKTKAGKVCLYLIFVRKAQLTDGLNDHGVHLVWTELQLVAGQTGGGKETHKTKK